MCNESTIDAGVRMYVTCSPAYDMRLYARVRTYYLLYVCVVLDRECAVCVCVMVYIDCAWLGVKPQYTLCDLRWRAL